MHSSSLAAAGSPEGEALSTQNLQPLLGRDIPRGCSYPQFLLDASGPPCSEGPPVSLPIHGAARTAGVGAVPGCIGPTGLGWEEEQEEGLPLHFPLT